VIFTDYIKAFGLLKQEPGVDYPVNARIRYVLAYNLVKIMASVAEFRCTVKKYEMLQGNSLSSLYFNTATADSTGSEETIKQCHHYPCMLVIW
jgi:hypothetical protein